MAKRINPFTDFGFKYIFGRESAKEYLIDFLNVLLDKEPNFEPISDITYSDKEHNGSGPQDRGIIYDINCVTPSGKQFIVEMQNTSQTYFLDRSVYYCCRAISEQGLKGDDWEYDIKPVYVISFVNFEIKGLEGQQRADIGLCNLETKKLISDKIRLIYIQLPKFREKKEEDCKNTFDWWLYNLINMETMEQLAFIQQHRLFERLSKVTEYAALDKEQRRRYDADLKAYRDLTNSMRFIATDNFAKGHKEGREEGREEGRKEGRKEGREEGHKEGRKEGRKEEKMETACRMFDNGFDIDIISKITGLSLDEIREAISESESLN